MFFGQSAGHFGRRVLSASDQGQQGALMANISILNPSIGFYFCCALPLEIVEAARNARLTQSEGSSAG